jgi:hypothetical protein
MGVNDPRACSQCRPTFGWGSFTPLVSVVVPVCVAARVSHPVVRNDVLQSVATTAAMPRARRGPSRAGAYAPVRGADQGSPLCSDLASREARAVPRAHLFDDLPIARGLDVAVAVRSSMAIT